MKSLRSEKIGPCPECGGPRAFFKRKSGIPSSPRSIVSYVIIVYAHICLECGHTSLRIHPDDMERLRKAAETAEGNAPRRCPECEGPQVFFKGIDGLADFIPLGLMKFANLYTCICLACGGVTKRPHPKDLDELRKAAEQRKTVQF